MSDQIQGGMAEAMRLMQKGDLTEATAVIQRTLGGSSFGSGFASVASPDAHSGAGADRRRKQRRRRNPAPWGG